MSGPASLAGTRAAYDLVAEDYAELLRDDLADQPLDRALLAAFAELSLPGRPVADLGCGPGRLTGHLHGLGLRVLGVDLSPRMVDVARRRHPHLRFDVGDIADLGIGDAALGGVLAWYSLIHTPTEQLPRLIAEMRRVLAPGAPLLVAFQVGDRPAQQARPYGHDVVLVNHRRPAAVVAALLEQADLVVQAVLERAPQASYERTTQAYLLAQRAPVDGPGAS